MENWGPVSPSASLSPSLAAPLHLFVRRPSVAAVGRPRAGSCSAVPSVRPPNLTGLHVLHAMYAMYGISGMSVMSCGECMLRRSDMLV